jgi:hypothetical protein
MTPAEYREMALINSRSYVALAKLYGRRGEKELETEAINSSNWWKDVVGGIDSGRIRIEVAA